jgi:hypothetical protein
MEEKKEAEELGYDEIVWRTPESEEEFKNVLSAFEESMSILEDSDEFESDDLPVAIEEESIAFDFNDIEIDQIGDLE